MREAGFANFDLGAWFGMWGPASMPSAIVNRLSRATEAIWRQPDKTAALSALAVERFFLPPGEFLQFVRDESAKWARVIEITKIEPQ
jgi:tripartite-type tricarboxylate transporter receptor subunit TctC